MKWLMKWVFGTLVALNIIVFAGIVAFKMTKQRQQNLPSVVQQTPPQTQGQQGKEDTKNDITITINNPPQQQQPPAITGGQRIPASPGTAPARRNPPQRPPAEQQTGSGGDGQKTCTASISMPEDDYHRIKGLLPTHAANRQVVKAENSKDGGQSAARMNVLFPGADEANFNAIQSVVGRYGKLSRSCK